MTKTVPIVLHLLIAVIGYAIPVAQATDGYSDRPIYGNEYGLCPEVDPALATETQGALNPNELTTLYNLAFPQTYTALVGAVGKAAYNDATYDYYQILGTNQWIAVEYDGGQNAIALHFSN